MRVAGQLWPVPLRGSRFRNSAGFPPRRIFRCPPRRRGPAGGGRQAAPLIFNHHGRSVGDGNCNARRPCRPAVFSAGRGDVVSAVCSSCTLPSFRRNSRPVRATCGWRRNDMHGALAGKRRCTRQVGLDRRWPSASSTRSTHSSVTIDFDLTTLLTLLLARDRSIVPLPRPGVGPRDVGPRARCSPRTRPAVCRDWLRVLLIDAPPRASPESRHRIGHGPVRLARPLALTPSDAGRSGSYSPLVLSVRNSAPSRWCCVVVMFWRL